MLADHVINFSEDAFRAATAPHVGGTDFTVHDVRRWLFAATEFGASDLHLRASHRPVVRWHGHVVGLAGLTADHPESHAEERISSLAVDAVRAHFLGFFSSDQQQSLAQDYIARGFIDLAFPVPGCTLRVRFYKEAAGSAALFRFLYRQHFSLHQSGLSRLHPFLQEHPAGLLLISGPPCSGRTSVAMGCLEYLNISAPAHVVTLDSPSEVFFVEHKARFSQISVGPHVLSFSAAIAELWGLSPQVLYVGDIITPEHALAVVDAVANGLFVVATILSASVADAFAQLFAKLPPFEHVRAKALLSSKPSVVVNQRLLPTRAQNQALLYETFVGPSNLRACFSSMDFSPLQAVVRDRTSMDAREKAMTIRWDDRLVALLDESAADAVILSDTDIYRVAHEAAYVFSKLSARQRVRSISA